MKSHALKPLALLLVLLTLVPMLAACSDSPSNQSGGEGTNLTDRSTLPADLNFKCADYSFIARLTTSNLDVEELTGEGINDAIYKRNRNTEDRLGVKIRVDNLTDTVDEMRNIIYAGDTGYAAAQEDMPAMARYMQAGYFYSLDYLTYVNTDQSYWTEGVIDALAVHDKKFLLAGDLSILDNCSIWCLFFNKEMLADLHLDNPYDALHDGKWTLDFFEKSATAAALDVDNDGVWNYQTDRFASIGMRNCFCGMYNAMGQTTYIRDDDGSFVYNTGSESSLNTLMAITEWANKGYRKYYLTVDMLGSTGDSASWDKMSVPWVEGRSLYSHATVNSVTSDEERGLDFDYGILPLPKLDEKQPDYVSSPSEWASLVYAVPICTPDIDMSGAVLECLCDYSTDTIRHAFYDVAIHRKYTRDVESLPSLDILFDNMIIDPGFVFGFVGDTPYRNIIRQGVIDNKIVTTVAKYQKAIQKSMAAVEEDIDKIHY